MNPQKLLWLDIETTGLDSTKDVILEVAAYVTPFNDMFARPQSEEEIVHKVIRFADWSAVDPLVTAMHAKSGLVADCVQSYLARDHAQAALIRLLGFDPDATQRMPSDSDALIPLAGSTVHFDLAFIKRQMPRLAMYLSHRVLDASGLRLYCYSLGMPEMPKFESAHRAKQDIFASSALAETCHAWLQESRCGEKLRPNKMKEDKDEEERKTR